MQNLEANIVKGGKSYFCKLCKSNVERANILMCTALRSQENAASSTTENMFYSFSNTEMIDDCSSFKCFCCKSTAQGKRWPLSNYFLEQECSQNITETLMNMLTNDKPVSSATDNLSLNGASPLKMLKNYSPKARLPMSVNTNKEALDTEDLKVSEYNHVPNHFLSSQGILVNEDIASSVTKKSRMWLFQQLLAIVRGAAPDRQELPASKKFEAVVIERRYAAQFSATPNNKIAMARPPPLNKKEGVHNSGLIMSADIFLDIEQQLSLSPKRPQQWPETKGRNFKAIETPKQGLTSRLNIDYSAAHLKIEEQMYTLNVEKLFILQETCNSFTRLAADLYCPICSKTVPNNRQSVYEHSFDLQHVTKFKELTKESETHNLLREYIQKSVTVVKCNACIKIIQMPIDLIHKHITSGDHEKCKKIQAKNNQKSGIVIMCNKNHDHTEKCKGIQAENNQKSGTVITCNKNHDHTEKCKGIQAENNQKSDTVITCNKNHDHTEKCKGIQAENNQKSDTLLECDTIIAILQMCNKLIAEHIKGAAHRKRHDAIRTANFAVLNEILGEVKNCWYRIQRYCCVLCQMSFNYKIEFLQHIVGKHRRYIESSDYIFDFCLCCATLWFGFVDSYDAHCKDIMHKYLVKSETFKIEDIPNRVTKLLTDIDKTINGLYEESDAVLQNKKVQTEVKQSLTDNLKSMFPDLEVHFFGSRVTGLGFPDSDIHVYIETSTKKKTEYAYSTENSDDVIAIIWRIANALKERQEEWIVNRTIENSRVPVIKLKHRRTDLDCDITVTNCMAVENSKLIRSYNVAYPPCRKLILFLKQWLSLCNLNGRDGITNYALACFVIFYLQQNLHSRLPSIATLIKNGGRSRVISGWETGVAQPKCNARTDIPIRELLYHFFLFYSTTFDYRHQVASPFIGNTVAKRSFTEPDTLPKEMEAYVRHIKEPNHEYFRIDSPMCIQDPFVLSHNLTKAVSNRTLSHFRDYCSKSATILMNMCMPQRRSGLSG